MPRSLSPPTSFFPTAPPVRAGTQVAVLLALFTLPLAAQSPIFPEQVGEFLKSAPKTLAVTDLALYTEYGLDATEQADYKGPQKHFTATAWRFKDSTGALAMFELRRPPGTPAAKVTNLSIRTSDGIILAYGNYVFQFTGDVPGEAELNRIYFTLPKWENTPLPALVGFLPAEGLIPNSERYVVGPVSLERFESRIPPSVAAFRMGSEAQLGKYKSPKGDITLAIFNYPTPSIARERFEEFQKLPGAVAKRSVTLVAVVIQPPDADAAERVLSRVRYQANLTVNEKVPQNLNKGLSNMVLSIMALAGIVVGLCIVAGVGFGFFRVMAKKLGWKEELPALTVLHLKDKTPHV